LSSVVNAETGVPCRRREGRELGMAHMNQSRVISALQVDLRLLFNAVVDNRIEPIAIANWRNRTRRTVLE